MGWERRGNSTYYYQKIREGGRVVSRYCGRGAAAEAMAAMTAYDRWQANRERERGRGEIEQAEQATAAALAALRDLDRAAGAAMRAALHEAGYHQHDRGAWRRRRG